MRIFSGAWEIAQNWREGVGRTGNFKEASLFRVLETSTLKIT